MIAAARLPSKSFSEIARLILDSMSEKKRRDERKSVSEDELGRQLEETQLTLDLLLLLVDLDLV